ncbi:ankyrin repeat domain-containing protein [Pseudanabaena sp. 'Roaring Creek']|uniref:ankyrin repeat domain-containing protein n=1 Tax=Pseudanabaena sp. 'Roaring Creek' TaxID=1681830 RepID=UPI0006D83A90|nr:ankyrin repeat domain-containing protein [Pseudanabaena sp. 'Roaring Creek']
MAEAFDELIKAIDEADAAEVRRLVTVHPALLEQTDSYGFTPLMHAASCMSREVVVIRELLDAGAAVNRQTDGGYTALHCAIDVNGEANLNSREVIALLVEAGADLTLRQHYGWTPLLRAVVEGTLDEVDALLTAGADPNVVLPVDTLPECDSGLTALMAAVTNAYGEDVITFLLRAGANPLVRNTDGATFPEYLDGLLAEYPSGDFSAQVHQCREVLRQHVAQKSNQSN